MPESEHPHVLLATLGGKPEIVTFTLDLLLPKFPISEVIVIHTASHPRLAQAIARLSAEFADDRYTFADEQRIIHFRRYSLRNYGQPIDDIVDNDSADATLTAMDDLIADLKRRLAVIHFSISGGRRLMSFLSFSAALLNFTHRDHLWHICTPEVPKQRVQESGEMHARPEDAVRLIEVPFARMAQPFLPIALDELHRRETKSQPEPDDKQESEQYGVQRINAGNEQVDNEQRAKCKQLIQMLTPGQRKVLRTFAQRLAPQQVADQLGISVTTVSSHTTAIYLKIRDVWHIDRALNYRDLQILFGDHLDLFSPGERTEVKESIAHHT